MKNQATVDDYNRYCDFLQRMTPAGCTSDFFHHPVDLVREIDHLESGTLFYFASVSRLKSKSNQDSYNE
jgi:hypothetical protein